MTKKERKAYHEAYRKANLDKFCGYSWLWAQNNPEKKKAINKTYREVTPDKEKARHKAYRKANKESIKVQRKVYRERHKEEIRIYDTIWREANPDKTRNRDRKRQALKYKVPFEPINDKRIFIRDGWVCQICHKRVNKKLKYPNPMCASLDHIIPLSEGGHDLYSNVQLAHLRCNLSKGARVILKGEQLRMF